MLISNVMMRIGELSLLLVDDRRVRYSPGKNASHGSKSAVLAAVYCQRK